MEKRSITFDKAPLVKGAVKLAKAVGSTLGPNGMNVLYEKALDYPVATKDGVTVARQVWLEDPIENMGAQAVKEVAEKVVTAAGDGTTTATIIAAAIIEEGYQYLKDNPGDIKSFRDAADSIKQYTLNQIRDRKKIIAEDDFEKIFQVAKISCNGDEPIAGFITECFQKVGPEGNIDVLRSRTGKSYVKISDGFAFDRGYQMPEFVNVEGRMKVQFSNPIILVYRETVKRTEELDYFLQLSMSTKRPLVVIADGFEQHVNQEFVAMRRRGLEICSIKTPGFGDRKRFVIDDVCVQVGAKQCDAQSIKMAEQHSGVYLGACETISVEENKTTIIGGIGAREEIDQAKERVKILIKDSKDDYDRSENKKRLAMLSNGVAVIHVGAQSEIALNERRDRVDDALGATKAAVEEGYLPGAGTTLARIATEYERENGKFPISGIFLNALWAPFMRLHENNFTSENRITSYVAQIVEYVDPWEKGYNIYGQYRDLIKEGIIDPAKVTRVCVEHAFSVAMTILTTNAIINIIPENKKKSLEEFIDNGIS